MGGTCDTDASNYEIATAVLTIPQTINTNNMVGTIKYQYHYHNENSSCCYKKPTTGTYYYDGEDGSGNGASVFICNNCGYVYRGYSDRTGDTHICNSALYNCGYNNGQLIGAIITY